jgi:signal peptidase I
VSDQVGASQQPAQPTGTSSSAVPLSADERFGDRLPGEEDHRNGDATRPHESRRRAALEWGVLIGAALIVALVARAFVFQAYYIPSDSMVPRLETGDRVIVSKVAYDLRDPHRGDLVVFSKPPSWNIQGVNTLVKRVVGLPGETIQGKDGRIYINGKPLPESYLPPTVQSKTFGPEQIPAGSYFMLGDNRQNSEDSAYFSSAVNKKYFVGPVELTFWPVNRLVVPGVVWLVLGLVVIGLLGWWLSSIIRTPRRGRASPV